MSRILLITPDFPPHSGGIGELMKNIQNYSSHNIEVITEYTGKYPISERNIISKDLSGMSGLITCLSFLRKNGKYYDGIHFGHPLYSGLGAILDLKYTVHTHAREIFRNTQNLSGKASYQLTKLGLKSALGVIAVSEFTKNKVDSITKEKNRSVFIPPGVSDRYFVDSHSSDRNWLAEKHSLQPDRTFLLTVSRLDERKGHQTVIKSLDSIDVEYVICGEGDEEYKNQLINLTKQRGVEDRVHFVGYIDEAELPRYYSGSDIYVMPSDYIEDTNNVEGFGISFLEANAAGTPVIGTKTGGIPSAINHNKSGVLIDPNSGSIVESVNYILLKGRDYFDCRAWAKKHRWQNQIKSIDSFFSEKFVNSC